VHQERPPEGPPTEQPEATVAKTMRMFNQKKYGTMEKYDFFKKDGVRPSEEQLRLTKLFYQNAPEIYAHFNEWKDIDKFYFIPLHMEMTYSCSGWVAEMAPDPVWLGSFVRCTLEHPELFQFRCPGCGKRVYPYRYVGSPLSGRVDLEGRCECGWSGCESVVGWRKRATVLRDRLAADSARYRWFRVLHPVSKPACVAELLESLEDC
jgi:hypothetical protein